MAFTQSGPASGSNFNPSNPYAQPNNAAVPLNNGSLYTGVAAPAAPAPAPAMGMGGLGPQTPPGQTPGSAPANYYGMTTTPDTNEQAAGVQAQPFYSMMNPSGQLQSPYSVDPSQSTAFNQEAQTAESGSLSPWAAMQMQTNQLQTQTSKDQNAAQAQGATDQAMQNIETQGGGASSGAQQQVAMGGARAQTMANQQANNAGNLNALNIEQTDAQNKQSMLGQVASTQTAAQAANAATAQTDTQNANLYSTNRYNQQMGAYGSQQTANAQRSAANSGKK